MNFTWDVCSLNPRGIGDWRLIGRRSVSAEVPGRQAWMSPGCGGWNAGKCIAISGSKDSDGIPGLGCSICRVSLLVLLDENGVIRIVNNQTGLTSLARTPSILKSRRGFTVASFIDRNWNREVKQDKWTLENLYKKMHNTRKSWSEPKLKSIRNWNYLLVPQPAAVAIARSLWFRRALQLYR